jgi:hypothetical protein
LRLLTAARHSGSLNRTPIVCQPLWAPDTSSDICEVAWKNV